MTGCMLFYDLVGYSLSLSQISSQEASMLWKKAKDFHAKSNTKELQKEPSTNIIYMVLWIIQFSA